MIWHIEKIETLISFFGSDEKLGLSAENANAMRAKFGENNITPPPQKFKIIPFILDIISVRLVLLFTAFVISIVYAIINPEYSPFEALVLLLAFIIYLGAKTLIFFKKQKNVTYALSADENAVILRDGKECLIKACDLVVGDILVLRAGNKIPADARIIKVVNAQVDESILTGESLAIEKDASKKALKFLDEFLSEDEVKKCKAFLNDARLTYWADFLRACLGWTAMSRKTKLFN